MAELANAAETAGTAIPEQLTAWLTPLLIALLIVAALWALLALFGWVKRRAYNVTEMERVKSRQLAPDFLKVDHEAREAALERGDAYTRERAGRPHPTEAEAPPEEPPALRKISIYARLAGVGSVLLAVANLVIAAAGALRKAQETHEFFYQLTSWERLQALFENYWIGMAVAVIVIIVNLVLVIRVLMKRQAR